MSDNTENNKRIAKNTILLYIRMIFTMAVSLYTSRVVLNTLGIENFGIYNVVGGIVTLFAFLNGAMASGTQRFLSYELGKKNYIQLGKIFSLTLSIHVLIAFVIFILAETAGLWLLYNKMIIPENRMDAAIWVYQFSILSFMISVIQVPYNASIIAHEKMSVYAYISIVDVILKLLVVFLLTWISVDKLKLYAGLIFGVSFFTAMIYQIYCRKQFLECKYYFVWDKSLFKTLFSYAGWNMFGNVASVAFGQGVNIVLNIFYGPVVNASRGIAFQVNGAITSFVYNFQVAVNPQIIKSYAADDRGYMMSLIFKSSKYSFFLLILLSLPFLMEMEFILRIWLKIVPEYSVSFCRLIIVNALIDTLSGPLMVAAQATGRIKIYQMTVGILLLLNLPLSYLFLKLGYVPDVTICISIVISLLALASRLIILHELIGLSISDFFKNVIIRILSVCICVLPPLLWLVSRINGSISSFILISLCSVSLTFLFIYIIGMDFSEKVFLKAKWMKIRKQLLQ